MEDVTVKVSLPSGAKLLVAARQTNIASAIDAEEVVHGSDDLSPDTEELVGAFDTSLTPVLKTIEELANELYGVLDRAKPAKASVEFGIELAWAPGKLLSALLVNGSSKAAIKVTLEWTKSAEPTKIAGS